MLLRKNVLILGSTGPSGHRIVEEALERGYHVTVYDRKTDKLPEALRMNENLTVCPLYPFYP
jgi:nucleoside-diphosphate-sugar epimerase